MHLLAIYLYEQQLLYRLNNDRNKHLIIESLAASVIRTSLIERVRTCIKATKKFAVTPKQFLVQHLRQPTITDDLSSIAPITFGAHTLCRTFPMATIFWNCPEKRKANCSYEARYVYPPIVLLSADSLKLLPPAPGLLGPTYQGPEVLDPQESLAARQFDADLRAGQRIRSCIVVGEGRDAKGRRH